jgi:membrane-associated phospholipid phosphatase
MQSQEKETDINVDSIPVTNKLKIKNFIVPTGLITYGFIALENKSLRLVNRNIRKTVNSNIDGRVTIDDFTLAVPALYVYALNLAGIKGKHNLRDRTIIFATSTIITNAAVFGLKNLIKELRPDGSNNKSFPSGNTANAFAGAEFLWQEYKDVFHWYGVSGYIVAARTGAFRIIKDKHWPSDVFAGAGFGVLSTRVVYIISPWIQKTLFPNKTKTIFIFAPFYNGEQMGIGFVRTFKEYLFSKINNFKQCIFYNQL